VIEPSGGAAAAGQQDGGTSGPPGGASGPLGAWAPSGAAPGVYCPFLASIDLDDRVRQARPLADTANRCLSTGEPVAPSAQDQRTLCLTADHPACVRFARATHVGREPEPAPAGGRRLSAPILAAAAVLVLAAALAGISLAANGDLSVGVVPAPGSPSAEASASPVAGAPAAAVPTAAAAIVGTPAASTAPAPATAAPTAAVEAATSAPPTPTPKPRPTPTPRPKKYPGLTPCPGTADCFIYVVKSGDALGAIADRYGFTLDEVLARNPSIRDPGLIVRGQEIRLPTPKG
jgi:LysM repeat protein